jgi:hypothetical protein
MSNQHQHQRIHTGTPYLLACALAQYADDSLSSC